MTIITTIHMFQLEFSNILIAKKLLKKHRKLQEEHNFREEFKSNSIQCCYCCLQSTS